MPLYNDPFFPHCLTAQYSLFDLLTIIQATFQRYPRPEKEYQSFSLIYNDRSLDLVRPLSA